MTLEEAIGESQIDSFYRFYVKPNIDDKKLKNALNSYESSLKNEDVLVVIDDTFAGNGKVGCLVAEDRLEVKDDFEEAVTYLFKDVDSVHCRKGMLYVNSKKIKKFIMPERGDLEIFFQFLNDYVCKASTNSSLPGQSHSTEEKKETTSNVGSLADEDAEFKRCVYCDEKIKRNAVKCKHCGSFQDGDNRENYSNADLVNDVADVGIGAVMWYLVVGPEVVILSVIVGALFESWWAFGIVFAGLILTLFFRMLAWLAAIILTLSWGVVGYGIGDLMQDLSASIVLGLILMLISFFIHYMAFGLGIRGRNS